MGKIYHKQLDRFSNIGIWEITESVDELLAQLTLESEEQKLFDRFQNDKRKQHWLSYRILLKELLSPTEYSHIEYDKNGKPHLAYYAHQLSVSHSGNFAAAIISEQYPVGIDIELIHPRIEPLSSKFLSTKELEHIDHSNRIEQLYVYWGAKEALYKLYGKKGLIFPEEIMIHPFSYAEKGEIKGSIHTKSFGQTFNLTYEKINEYMMVYATG